jgi:hypothetical protein
MSLIPIPRRLRIALPGAATALALLTTAQTLTPAQTLATPQTQAPAQAQRVDPALARLIDSVPAIDNHAHPVLAPPADAQDRDFDALPVDAMEPQSDPVALRPDSPALGDAWKALYGFSEPPPLDAAGLRRLDAARTRVKVHDKQHYPAWVLDRAGIGAMLANRVALGPGVEPPRFRWVPYADALLFPLDNSAMAAASPDRRQFFALEDKLRGRYLQQAGLAHMPPTLDGYLTRLVLPTLRRHRAAGALAEKFEVAYLRSFDFSNPPKDRAARVYARWIGGGVPDAPDYKLLQDYLFRRIALACGQLGMAVHLHAMAGAGGYFSVAGVNPLLLEPVFNDPALRHTNFVLLHGGWPYVREIGALLQKPNVYLDISQQSLTIPPHTQAQWLREWLEWEPEKVLFATDGYPYSQELGWPESTWIASRNGREALGIALTGMLQDSEITPAGAARLARMVLRGNAEALYGLPPDSVPAKPAAIPGSPPRAP